MFENNKKLVIECGLLKLDGRAIMYRATAGTFVGYGDTTNAAVGDMIISLLNSGYSVVGYRHIEYEDMNVNKK